MPIDLEVIVKIYLFWIKGNCQVLCEINGLSTVQLENLNMSGFVLADIILLESDGLSCIFLFNKDWQFHWKKQRKKEEEEEESYTIICVVILFR